MKMGLSRILHNEMFAPKDTFGLGSAYEGQNVRHGA